MKKSISKTVVINKTGLGFTSFKKVYNKIGLNSKRNNIAIKFKHQKKLNKFFQTVSYSQTLKSKMKRSVGFYLKIRNYRGIRHLYNFPVRGQRTHTNAKTRKKHEKKNQIVQNEENLEKRKQQTIQKQKKK